MDDKVNTLFQSVLTHLKVIEGIVRGCAEKIRAEKDPGYRAAIGRNAVEAIRWHVRGLFLIAFTEGDGPKKIKPEERAALLQELDTELTELGNLVKGVSKAVGHLYFPHDPLHKWTEKDYMALVALDDAPRVD